RVEESIRTLREHGPPGLEVAGRRFVVAGPAKVDVIMDDRGARRQAGEGVGRDLIWRTWGVGISVLRDAAIDRGLDDHRRFHRASSYRLPLNSCDWSSASRPASYSLLIRCRWSLPLGVLNNEPGATKTTPAI